VDISNITAPELDTMGNRIPLSSVFLSNLERPIQSFLCCVADSICEQCNLPESQKRTVSLALQDASENKYHTIQSCFRDSRTSRIAALLCERFEASPTSLLSLLIELGCLLEDRDLLSYLMNVILAYSYLCYISLLEYPVISEDILPTPGTLFSNLARALLHLKGGIPEPMCMIPCDIIRLMGVPAPSRNHPLVKNIVPDPAASGFPSSTPLLAPNRFSRTEEVTEAPSHDVRPTSPLPFDGIRPLAVRGRKPTVRVDDITAPGLGADGIRVPLSDVFVSNLGLPIQRLLRHVADAICDQCDLPGDQRSTIEAILLHGQSDKLKLILPYFKDPDKARVVELLCARFEDSPPRLLSLVVDVYPPSVPLAAPKLSTPPPPVPSRTRIPTPPPTSSPTTHPSPQEEEHYEFSVFEHGTPDDVPDERTYDEKVYDEESSSHVQIDSRSSRAPRDLFQLLVQRLWEQLHGAKAPPYPQLLRGTPFYLHTVFFQDFFDWMQDQLNFSVAIEYKWQTLRPWDPGRYHGSESSLPSFRLPYDGNGFRVAQKSTNHDRRALHTMTKLSLDSLIDAERVILARFRQRLSRFLGQALYFKGDYKKIISFKNLNYHRWYIRIQYLKLL